jgi:hypothetical protein
MPRIATTTSLLIFEQYKQCRRIRFIEGDATSLLLQKDFAAAVYLFEVPSHPRFLFFVLGWECNFMGSESGHMQSIKVLQNMVSNTTELQRKVSQRDAAWDCLGPLSWSAPVFLLAKEDFGTSLLQCPGKMFRQGS